MTSARTASPSQARASRFFMCRFDSRLLWQTFAAAWCLEPGGVAAVRSVLMRILEQSRIRRRQLREQPFAKRLTLGEQMSQLGRIRARHLVLQFRQVVLQQ